MLYDGRSCYNGRPCYNGKPCNGIIELDAEEQDKKKPNTNDVNLINVFSQKNLERKCHFVP